MIFSMPTAPAFRVLSALLTAFGLGSSVVMACSCVGVKPLCNVPLSGPDTRDRAAFIGRVIDVFPQERETLQRVLAHAPALVPPDQRTPSLDQQKQLRLQWAKGLLTPADHRRITDAKNEAELWDIQFRWARPRRVWLEVSEPFWGVKAGSVELSTSATEAACGVDFAVGKAYLVDANRNGATDRWHASLCSRTREVVAAQDEIDGLRAWQLGDTLSRRVYGVLSGGGSSRFRALTANQRLLLRGGRASQYETRSDERGYFRFVDVAPGQYRLEADIPGYRIIWIPLSQSARYRSVIDLEANRCVELFVSFDGLAP